jgi:hypothetical protein
MASERWYLKFSNTERFKGQGSIRPLVISLEEADGFPFINELQSLPNFEDPQEK